MIKIVPISDLEKYPNINIHEFTARVRIEGIHTIKTLTNLIYFIDDYDGTIIRSMTPYGSVGSDFSPVIHVGKGTTFLYFNDEDLFVRFIMSCPDLISIEKGTVYF